LTSLFVQIGQTANGTLEESHGNAQSPDMYLRQMQAQAAQSGHMQPALSPYLYSRLLLHLHHSWIHLSHLSHLSHLHLQHVHLLRWIHDVNWSPFISIALAKQQYQASMVAAAMQAAEDAWERGSSMTAFPP
jgi:hypothetical protein